MAIRDANRLANAATGGCADRVTAVTGGEVETLSWRSDSWTIVLGDKVPASMGDGDCLSREAVGAHHKASSAEADGCMADGATCLACGAIDKAG